MSLNGVLQDFSLDDVLTLLAGAQKTGALRLERLGETASIYFDRGLVYYATSRRADHLGADMVAAGLLDADAWDRVSREPGIAEHAVGSGTPPGRLQEFLEERIGDAIFSLLRWSDGAFRFQAEGVHPIGPWLHLPPAPLLVQAKRRLDEWATMTERVPSMQHRVRMRAELEGEAEVTLRATEWRVLVAIGEGTSVQAVAERLGLADFHAMREVYALVTADLVTVQDPLPTEHVLMVEALERDPAEAAQLRLSAPGADVETFEPAEFGVDAAVDDEDDEDEPDLEAIIEELGADPALFGTALGSTADEEADLYPVHAPADVAADPDREPPSALDQLLLAQGAQQDAGSVPYGHDVENADEDWRDAAPTAKHAAVVLPPAPEPAADQQEPAPGSVAAFAREFSRIMSDTKRRR